MVLLGQAYFGTTINLHVLGDFILEQCVILHSKFTANLFFGTDQFLGLTLVNRPEITAVQIKTLTVA